MRVLLRAGAVLALALLCGLGCAWGYVYRVPASPFVASGFNMTSAPMNLKLRSTGFGTKKGTASSKTIMGYVSWGDSSIAAAAKNGNIKTITHADSKFLNVLAVYGQHTTVVYGD